MRELGIVYSYIYMYRGVFSNFKITEPGPGFGPDFL